MIVAAANTGSSDANYFAGAAWPRLWALVFPRWRPCNLLHKCVYKCDVATEQKNKRRGIKITGFVDVGYLLDKIHEAGYHGIDDAAAGCHTGSKNIRMLFEFNGELPRLDALFRIRDGLKLDLEKLIRTAAPTDQTVEAAARKKNRSPGV